MPKEIRHTAFLIRWQDNESQTRWQSTVENAYTGEKLHFVNKIALIRFLLKSLFNGNAARDEDGMSLNNKPDLTDETQEHFRS